LNFFSRLDDSASSYLAYTLPKTASQEKVKARCRAFVCRHLMAWCRIVVERQNRLGAGFHVSRRVTIYSGANDVLRTSSYADHGRNSRGHCLQHDVAESVSLGGKYEDVHIGIGACQILAEKNAGKVAAPQIGCEPFPVVSFASSDLSSAKALRGFTGRQIKKEIRSRRGEAQLSFSSQVVRLPSVQQPVCGPV
jgi:hypothetical protein